MKRHFALILIPLLAIFSLVSACSAKKPASIDDNALLFLLAGTPTDPVNQAANYIYFMDFSAMEAAYSATRPANADEFSGIQDLGETYSVWWVVARNLQSALFAQTFIQLESMPQLVGFSTLDVDRTLEFGTPPNQGLILTGSFDPQVIESAYRDNLGMVSTGIDKFTIWCAEGDCTSGATIDLKSRMQENPFGGGLGQRHPMSISSDLLMASPDPEVVIAHLEAIAGRQPSLADDPGYQAAVAAISKDAFVLQALIANPFLVEEIANQQPVDNRLPPELLSLAQQRVQESFQELPAFDLFILADVVTEDEQIARLGFVYQDAAAAETAAPILLERLVGHPSIQLKPKLVGELLAERNVTEPRFYVVKEAGRAVLVLEFPTRKATTDEIVQMQNIGSQTTATPPGIVYRLFSQMLFSRDTGWMSTITRSELGTTN